MSDALPSATDLWRAYSYVPLRMAQVSPVGEALAVPGGLLVMAGVPVTGLNYGFVYGPDDPPRVMRLFAERLRALRLPGHIVSPAELGEGLTETAQALGLKSSRCSPLMIADEAHPAERVSSTRFTLHPLHDEAGFLETLPLMVAAFGDDAGYTELVYRPLLLHLPGVHLFTADESGTTVSYCMTVDDGSVVWFMDVATHPDRRGKGAATSLLIRTMDWWRARGRRRFGLGADPEAQNLYTSLGFRVAATARTWLVEAS